MSGRKRPAPENAGTARRIPLDGLARDADVLELVSELAPLHPRTTTFPGEVNSASLISRSRSAWEARELADRCLMSVPERLHDLLAVLRPVRFEEDPGQQVSGLNFRVMAVRDCVARFALGSATQAGRRPSGCAAARRVTSLTPILLFAARRSG